MVTDTHFVPLQSVDALAELFVRSHTAPVLLFNHDAACPISAFAYQQMKQLGGDIPIIDVIHAKDLTHAIATRTGVQHESPQVIVLRHGQSTWSASHFAIMTDAVQQALQEYA